jgi:transposase-like protein
MTCDLQNPIFNDETAAREALEATRWPNGPVCPHCGSVEKIAKVEGTKKSHRPGLYYCNACKGQFTVTVGTVFERSKIPLTKWWLATVLLTSSKKGISSHQLHRMLGVTYKTAWFMSHRIREGMAPAPASVEPMGGVGKVVEADETYIGKKRSKGEGERGYQHKMKVFTLVQRNGVARSVRVENVTTKELMPIIRHNVDPKSMVVTDEAMVYNSLKHQYPFHATVNHGEEEWTRGDAHTNTVEGFFSIFKRGMIGIYQHCSEAHLQRYLAEFDFRYSHRAKLGYNDSDRADVAMKGIGGKRLTYRRTSGAQQGA